MGAVWPGAGTAPAGSSPTYPPLNGQPSAYRQTVVVPIPATAAGARVLVNVDWFPALAGPNVQIDSVVVIDNTDAAGSAGLLYERLISGNTQSAILQLVNQGAGTSSGTLVVTASSFTPTLNSQNPSNDPLLGPLMAVLTGSPNIWDKRYNLPTLGGTNMVRWDPVVGGSDASIVANLANKPQVAFPGAPVTTNGVNQGAISAFLARFNPSLNYTIYFIGRQIKLSGGNPAYIIGSAANAGFVDIVPGAVVGLPGSSASGARTLGTLPQPNTRPLDNRVVVYKLTTNGTTATFNILPGTGQTSAVGAAPASANGAIALGSELTQAAFLQSETHAIVWLDHIATAVEDAAVLTYGIGIGEETYGSQSLFVHDGDSQTYGNGLADFTLNYPIQLQTHPLIAGVRRTSQINLGVTSKQLLGAGGLIATGPTLVDPLLRVGLLNQVLILWTGTNDFALGGATVAQVLAGVNTYVSARIAAGWNPKKIFYMGVLSRGDINIDALRDVFNPQAMTLCSQLAINGVPIYLDPIMGVDGAWSNATYFNADHVHPTAAGYARIVSVLAPYVANVMS